MLEIAYESPLHEVYRGWQDINSGWNLSHGNKMLEIAYESHLHGFYFFTLSATWDG